jgi:hypothetical protein
MAQQGMPALNYLYFAPGATAKFISPDSAKRKKYVRDVIRRLKNLTTDLLNNWQNRNHAIYMANEGSGAGKSVGCNDQPVCNGP